MRATRMYGRGWLASRFADHMKPMAPPLTQAPVTRPSRRASQFTPPGPGAE